MRLPSKVGDFKANIIDKAISLMTPIALLIALWIHAFFESLALGIEQTVSGAWIIVVAILAHKIGESLSLVSIHINKYIGNKLGKMI